jgi:hypothetical protein
MITFLAIVGGGGVIVAILILAFLIWVSTLARWN